MARIKERPSEALSCILMVLQAIMLVNLSVFQGSEILGLKRDL